MADDNVTQPQAEPLQPAPVSVQLSPLFWLSCCTVAVMLWVSPVCTETAVGATATPIAGAVALITTCAVAFFVGCACKTAAMVTVAGEGTAAGAVYRPVGSIVP